MVSDYWDELLAQNFYLYCWVQQQPQETEKSLLLFSSGLSETSGRTLLNCWQWHLDIWGCTVGWRTGNSRIIPNALHGDHPHVFDNTSSWEQHKNHVKKHCIQGKVKDVLYEKLCPVCTEGTEICWPLSHACFWRKENRLQFWLQSNGIAQRKVCLQRHRSLVYIAFLSRTSLEGGVELNRHQAIFRTSVVVIQPKRRVRELEKRRSRWENKFLWCDRLKC